MSLITIDPVGRQVAAAADETILDAALRSGVLLKHGCRDGRCGDCRTEVVGDLDPLTISYPEGIELKETDLNGSTVLCCQAVPLQSLTIHSPEVTEHVGISIQRLVSRVKEKVLLSSDVVLLKLMLAPGNELKYLPGQYVDITLPNDVTRSYSMATSVAEENTVELHIRLKPEGQGTPFIFNELQQRKMVKIQGPYGSFYLRETQLPIILLASGTGFAPIKAIMQQLIASFNKRPVVLYWGGRAEEDLYMGQLCREWEGSYEWFSYVPVISDETKGWQGRSGFVHQAVLDDFDDLSGYEVYACGSPIVVDSARTDFTKLKNLKVENFFSDSFI